jgi:peptidylprolyl isomerase
VNSDPNFIPDKINKVRIAADLPEDARPKVQVLKTDGASFDKFIQTQRKFSGKLPDICNIVIPTRRVDTVE